MTDARKGFAIITTVVLISTVLLLVSAAMAQGLIGHEQSVTSLEASLQAEEAAEACAEVALLSLAENSSYAGSETQTIDGNACTINAIASGLPTTIQTEASVNDRAYRLQVVVSSTDPITITSWQRVANF